jgi:putative endonuclease
MDQYYVYALRSKVDGFLYIGLSKNPAERLKQHNLGMTFSTKSRRPFELIYTEACSDRKTAREREKKLKSGSGREFLKKIK